MFIPCYVESAIRSIFLNDKMIREIQQSYFCVWHIVLF